MQILPDQGPDLSSAVAVGFMKHGRQAHVRSGHASRHPFEDTMGEAHLERPAMKPTTRVLPLPIAAYKARRFDRPSSQKRETAFRREPSNAKIELNKIAGILGCLHGCTTNPCDNVIALGRSCAFQIAIPLGLSFLHLRWLCWRARSIGSTYTSCGTAGGSCGIRDSGSHATA